MRNHNRFSVIGSRAYVIFVFFFAAFLGLATRLFWVQIIQHDRYAAQSESQAEEAQLIYSPRGTIYDRNKKQLAFSILVKSFYADPGMLNADPAEAARVLAPVLAMKEPVLQEKLSRKNTRFVWIERLLDPDKSEEVQKILKEKQWKGFGFVEESKRYYPSGGLLANVLGFVGVDGKGLDGLEKSLDDEISGGMKKQVLLHDAAGNPILHSAGAPYMGNDGRSVYLTIDESIQFFAERALDEAMVKTRAQGGIVIVMDPKTGGILAMVNRPSYDPNHFSNATENEYKNRAVVDIYEPGSTFKPIIASAALDAGTYSTDTVWHDPGAVWASGHAIRNWDDASYGDVRLVDILKFSINTGFAHIGLLTGGSVLTDYAQKFGFGRPTGIELPGEGAGLLFNPDDMRPIDVASMSIGQGIAVTPLQMVQAYSAIAGGGQMVRPYLIDSILNGDGTVFSQTETKIAGQPISKEVADTVKDMMEKEVSEGGGGNARVPGYHMGGKTGTAQKLDPVNGGYLKNQYIASFCGFGPTEDPRAICLVVLDNPQGAYYGGLVSAPVFAEIMGQTMRYLGVRPFKEEWPLQQGKAEETLRAPVQKGNSPYAVLPDFRGWSMRDVGEWLSDSGLGFKPEGSGFAWRQSPAAGVSVPKGSDVTVYFEQNQ